MIPAQIPIEFFILITITAFFAVSIDIALQHNSKKYGVNQLTKPNNKISNIFLVSCIVITFTTTIALFTHTITCAACFIQNINILITLMLFETEIITIYTSVKMTRDRFTRRGENTE